MLESLLLKDIQNHRRTLIEFGERVTILSGKTGSGKSAAVRALRWLALNQPPGNDLMGDFGRADYALVRGVFDGHPVYRKRSGSENAYRLDGEVYKSLGQGGVPDPVSRLLNLSEFNFQGQLDPPFWLTLPPPELSRQLNDIVSLGEIDDILDLAAREVRQAKSEITSTESRLTTAQGRAGRLAWAEEYADKIGKLEKLDQTIAQLDQDAARITSILEGGSRAYKRLQNATAVAKWDLPAWERAYETYRKESERLKTLDSILAGIASSEHQISMAELLIEEAKADLDKYQGLCPSCLQPLPTRSPSTAPTSTLTSGSQQVVLKRRTSG